MRADRPVTAALAALLLAAPAAAADPPRTAFSQAVSASVPDWVAEDWRHGTLRLHPAKFTWQSDDALDLSPAEPAANRTAQAALAAIWTDVKAGDDTVDMTGATEMAPGLLVKRYRWRYAFDDNLSLWGVVTTADGFLPVHANCVLNKPERYTAEQCTKAVATLLVALKTGALALPTPAAPLTVGGWDSQYLADGTSVLTAASFNGLRRATIRVSPPVRLAADGRRAAIERFADATRERDDGAPGPATWTASPTDPWLRRAFPNSFEGPAFQVVGAVTEPGGGTALISVHCPNPRWAKTCVAGGRAAILFTGTGVVERRRQALIAATQTPPPPGGLQDADIVGLYTEGHNTIGAGGYMTGYAIDGYLYLRDGTVLRDFDNAPAYLTAQSGKHGTWQRDGAHLRITWPDGKTETIEDTGTNLMVGGAPGLRLDGRFRHVAGGGNVAFGGGTTYLAESEYRFHPDGTFETDRSHSLLAAPGLGQDGGTTIVAGGGGPATLGHYAIDGYTLTLTYPDGRLSRLSFAVPAADRDGPVKQGVMLNGTYYFRDRKS